MNFGSVRSDPVKLFFWRGGLIFETNCIFEYKPSPHFRLDVVYKMEGRIKGTLRYLEYAIMKFLNVIGQCNGSELLVHPLGWSCICNSNVV